jgi:hypothetical protein
MPLAVLRASCRSAGSERVWLRMSKVAEAGKASSCEILLLLAFFFFSLRFFVFDQRAVTYRVSQTLLYVRTKASCTAVDLRGERAVG